MDAESVEAIPVEAVEVDQNGNSRRPVNPNRPTRQRPVRDDSSPWDSFKIYGYAGIIIGLLLAGFALRFILSREDADANIAGADEFYNQQNYQAAQDAYIGFLENFGQENKHSSAARTILFF